MPKDFGDLNKDELRTIGQMNSCLMGAFQPIENALNVDTYFCDDSAAVAAIRERIGQAKELLHDIYQDTLDASYWWMREPKKEAAP